MTKNELELNIVTLTQLAQKMPEPDRTFKLGEIDELAIQLQGVALNDLKSRLDKVNLTELETIDHQISATKNRSESQESTVEAFDFGMMLIKKALNR
ncbi:MAG: hypothetical protein Q9M50_05940 [Methylococcales bacterium]|nr:hypothetical protein [Methylococcales bacterium]